MLTSAGRCRTVWAVTATLGMLVIGGLVAAPATAAVPACEEGADERFEWWRPVCTEGPRIAVGGGSQVCELDPNLWGIEVSCQHPDYGWWSPNWQCYVRFESPQPAAGDPSWRGHDPSEGVIYQIMCPWMDGVDGQPWHAHAFLQFVPTGSGTLGEVVADAIGRLVITGPDIHLAPDPGGVGLVGLPVWMWTPATEQTWSPAPLRVLVLGWVLVVRATADRMVWDLGNGDVVVCDHGPGTPYQDPYGAGQSPDCGYPGYRWPSSARPGGVYQVSATTFWRIDWWFETAAGTRTGLAGVEQTSRAAGPVPVRIHELQVVTS
jgi:hypothetical protein